MPRFVRYALSLSLCLAGSNLFAQKALTELYGEGVHRYFAGDSSTADQLLSRVIESGVEDPRVYYFRGLAREYQGGGGEYDFEEGARLEAAGKGAFNIGFALTRIQGHTRAKIEKARRDARVAAEQQAMLMERARVEAGDVQPPTTVPSTPPVVPPADATDPFGGQPEESAAPPTVDPQQPATPEVDSLTDPFADDPAAAPTTPPTTEDPFNSDVPPADAPSADDPFGTESAPEAADPFGTESTPAGDAAGTDALDDPFAE